MRFAFGFLSSRLLLWWQSFLAERFPDSVPITQPKVMLHSIQLTNEQAEALKAQYKWKSQFPERYQPILTDSNLLFLSIREDDCLSIETSYLRRFWNRINDVTHPIVEEIEFEDDDYCEECGNLEEECICGDEDNDWT